ncbi:PREDICTED: uncharacterized protein LOC106751153 [Dinoponera quadriceps]|uniref:Uncharacterized protein LOC106751153 n=1 Tax=Dinoponera quadriceps TaxID=609295 RepID=A0A6P3Y975_DINQU|nr:PREDICTED: uncharacterized protein LOC106751153 [Dinoponera quadriceps]XP_014487470.1 PREDICTED: uncharacterized protein LOC106751153 [Dinoponera quadriceps]
MVKMDYPSLPKLIPIKTANICPDIVPKPAVSKWVQPCAIMRLLRQPNIDIKAVPVPTVEDPREVLRDYKRANILKRNFVRLSSKQSEAVVDTSDEEDGNLLPSKRKDKLSEIILIPVKPKSCRCAGPCETIICDVIVQQHVEEGKVSLMLALNINEEEIDALVGKHCDDEYCDALSIDHDRCRRGLVKLYKCDESDICDICMVPMTSWKSRLYHKKCEKKDEYRHNDVSKERLLKDRFRLQELRILHDLRARRKNYLDPVDGAVLAMEALRNNKELVILPKPSREPIVTVTTVPNGQLVPPVNSQISGQKNVVSGVTITIPPPSDVALFSNRAYLKGTRPAAQGTTYIVNPAHTQAVAMPPQNQYVKFVNLSVVNDQPAASTAPGNLIVPQPHVPTNSLAQSTKTVLEPIRVIPITNLKTAPSLLHRQQGVPKFCVVAGNVITTLTVPSLSALQPIIAANITAQAEQIPRAGRLLVPIVDASKTPPALLQKQRIFQQKSVFVKKPNKRFFCVYCCKHFSTDWYFKKHVAKHVSQKHPPKVSSTRAPTGDRHGTKRHPSSEEREPQESQGNDYACESPASLKSPTDGESNGSSGLRIKVEFDAECSNEYCADETECRAIGGPDEVGAKRIKCEDTFDAYGDNVEIFQNGIKIEKQDDYQDDYHDDYLEDAPVGEHDVEESLTYSENCDAKGHGITIVSVTGNTNRKNFEEEGIVAFR